jgi:sec-independent protein translocase protein TatC
MFNKSVLGVTSNFTFKNYVSFVATMMLVFGLAFQTPIAIFFLNKTGLVSIEALCKSRKYVVLGVVFVAAAATPGSDLLSLFALAVPIYLLFELGILLCRFSKQRKNAQNNTPQ